MRRRASGWAAAALVVAVAVLSLGACGGDDSSGGDEASAGGAAGDEPADEVVNLNVPTCPTGDVRGTVEVASATEGDALGTPDCTGPAGTAAPADDGDDVSAFLDGYATFTEVAAEPAA
jgi:hypothetical protein